MNPLFSKLPDSFRFIRPQRFEWLARHGLPPDHFTHPVAEVEWDTLDPLLQQPPPPIDAIRRVLREEQQLCVYGFSGSGKTFASFLIEQSARRTPHTLVVVLPYTPPAGIDSADTFFSDFLISLVIDMLLWWLENNNNEGDTQWHLLQNWIEYGGTDIGHLCKALIANRAPPKFSVWQIGKRRVSLPPISPFQHKVLHHLFQKWFSGSQHPAHNPYFQCLTLMDSLVAWGIRHVMVVADLFVTKADTGYLTLLQKIAGAQTTIPVSYVAFLPSDSESVAHSPSYRLEWSVQDLRYLLECRIAAPSSYGLDDIFTGDVTNMLIDASAGSPRRLLSLVNRVFEMCAIRDLHLPVDTFDLAAR